MPERAGARVVWALVLRELSERARDRWVLVSAGLFAALAVAVGAYGSHRAEGGAAALVAPSVVTLAALLVPLVALVLGHDAIAGERERHTLGLLASLPVHRWQIVLAKAVGRALALAIAVVLGLGGAALVSAPQAREPLLALVGPTVWLGLDFLAIGILLSTLAARQVTAASLAVATWFALVFFYDLGLVALLVATQGTLAPGLVRALVLGNPAGLYRVAVLGTQLSGMTEATGGQLAEAPGLLVRGVLWAAWATVPVLLSGLVLQLRRALK